MRIDVSVNVELEPGFVTLQRYIPSSDWDTLTMSMVLSNASYLLYPNPFVVAGRVVTRIRSVSWKFRIDYSARIITFDNL